MAIEPGDEKSYVAFVGHERVATGPLLEVALQLKARADRGTTRPPLLIDDATGTTIDVSLHGTREEVRARFEHLVAPYAQASDPGPRPRGRPRLGVVSREISLLPRHWEWLAEQPGGASVTLRKLVDQARKENEAQDRTRRARDAAYRFMQLMAGDLAGFEEAIRALFAGDVEKLAQHTRGWPVDIRAHAQALAARALGPASENGASCPPEPTA